APVGLTDRTLGMRCDPQIQPEGHATCVPRVAVAPAHFADPYCEERVVVAAAPPAAVGVLDANGCARHHATADEYTSLLYRRAGATCVRASLGAGERAYRVGAPLELAHLDRTVDAAPRHRLQQITIGTGGLRFVDTQLHDLATRTDCQSYGNGKLAVCVPRTSSLALRLWSNPSCTREALVTELPRVQCTKSVFAVDPDALTIHAIGAVHTAAVFGFDPSGNCRPRPPASDRVTYTLGPAIPPSTFVAGVVYSDR
ncbi:MAG TPA: hypothetical protein VK427_24380, partial [Kofleriaceae bacterium]|nr:hypothetical protein [Kofleriaceae bacterium]